MNIAFTLKGKPGQVEIENVYDLTDQIGLAVLAIVGFTCRAGVTSRSDLVSRLALTIVSDFHTFEEINLGEICEGDWSGTATPPTLALPPSKSEEVGGVNVSI